MASRGRRTALVVVCALLTILLLFGGGVWREIAADYHLWRLRTDAGYFERLAEASEESAGGIAMRRFAEDPSGAIVLVGAIQDELNDTAIHALFSTTFGLSHVGMDQDDPRPSLDEYRFEYDATRDRWIWSWSEQTVPVRNTTPRAAKLMGWLRYADGFELESLSSPGRILTVRLAEDPREHEWRVRISVREDPTP